MHLPHCSSERNSGGKDNYMGKMPKFHPWPLDTEGLVSLTEVPQDAGPLVNRPAKDGGKEDYCRPEVHSVGEVCLL